MRSKVPDFFTMVACGDREAEHFLMMWASYMHITDDICDNDLWTPEDIISCLALAVSFYSDPYYVKHARQLQVPVLMATTVWADSCIWEREPELWKRQFADVMRHSGNEVICMVAFLQGGWDHMRQISLPLMATCYIYHKDKYGLPQ